MTFRLSSALPSTPLIPSAGPLFRPGRIFAHFHTELAQIFTNVFYFMYSTSSKHFFFANNSTFITAESKTIGHPRSKHARCGLSLAIYDSQARQVIIWTRMCIDRPVTVPHMRCRLAEPRYYEDRLS